MPGLWWLKTWKTMWSSYHGNTTQKRSRGEHFEWHLLAGFQDILQQILPDCNARYQASSCKGVCSFQGCLVSCFWAHVKVMLCDYWWKILPKINNINLEVGFVRFAMVQDHTTAIWSLNPQSVVGLMCYLQTMFAQQ